MGKLFARVGLDENGPSRDQLFADQKMSIFLVYSVAESSSVYPSEARGGIKLKNKLSSLS
jgi:hypothetical protein